MGNKIWTFVWKKYLAPLCISGTLAYGFIALPQIFPFLSSWMDIVADPTPDWYTKVYYNTINDIAVTPDTFPDIILLDLKEAFTRKDLADLIQLVANGSPKAVGVDCTFSTSDSYDSEQTDYLIRTIAQLDTIPPFIFASVINEESVIPDSIILHKGFVDAFEYNHYVAYKEGTPHLALEMANLAGYDIKRMNTNTFMVNYRTKSFYNIPIYSDFMEYGNYIQERITNKIVLIGGVDNRLDMHYAPFKISSEGTMVSGSRILAYALSSIITATTTKDCNNKVFHYYSRCPLWVNLIFTILFTFIYLNIYMLIVWAQQKSRWVELCKPLLLFVMLVLILVFSMILTTNRCCVPYIGFFIVLSVFLGFSYDVFNPNTNIDVKHRKDTHTKSTVKRRK